jgi:hypothetical protein
MVAELAMIKQGTEAAGIGRESEEDRVGLAMEFAHLREQITDMEERLAKGE